MALGAMAAALKNAGVIKQEQIDAVEEAQKKAVIAEEERKLNEQNAARQARLREEREYTAKVAPFNDRMNTENGRRFIYHLVHAMTPWNKAEKLWAHDGTHDTNCCFCNIGILSFAEIMQNKVGEKMVKQMGEQLEFELKNMDENGQVPKEKLIELKQKQREELFGNKVIGYTSSETSKVMCTSCYTSFYEWVSNQIMQGNRTINKIIRKKMLEGA